MFCKLEQDLNTFNFLKNYLSKTKDISNPKEIFSLDNRLQSEEIIKHLYVNRKDLEDLLESCQWVHDYSKNYRSYLNSIKIMKLVIDCICTIQDKSPDDISFEDFKKIEDIFNQEKDSLLELIF